MFLYLGNILILLFLSIKELIDGKFSKYFSNFIMTFLVIGMSLIAGIRLNIGQDFGTYNLIFNQVTTFNDLSFWLEPGFRYIIVVAKSIGFTSQGLFFVFAFFTYSFTARGLTKINHYPFTSFFLFYMLFNIGYVFNVIRQGIAMSILIFLIMDIIHNKFFKVMFFGLIAGSIHTVGYAIILIYFLRNIDFKKNTYIILTLINVALVPISSLLSNTLVAILPSGLQGKIVSYSDNFIGSVDFLGLAQRLIFLILMLIYFNKLREKNGKYFEFMMFTYYVGFSIYCIFSFQGMFATRINMFFRVLEICLYPCLLDISILRKEKVLLFILILSIVILVFVSEIRNPVNFPFKTIFSVQ